MAVVGLALPFGLGCAVSIGLYHQFIDQSATTFLHFMLFIGTSMYVNKLIHLLLFLTRRFRLQVDHRFAIRLMVRNAGQSTEKLSSPAFPVLARILTELGLMTDRVGVIVLAAGVANDVVGWCVPFAPFPPSLPVLRVPSSFQDLARSHHCTR